MTINQTSNPTHFSTQHFSLWPSTKTGNISLQPFGCKREREREREKEKNKKASKQGNTPIGDNGPNGLQATGILTGDLSSNGCASVQNIRKNIIPVMFYRPVNFYVARKP